MSETNISVPASVPDESFVPDKSLSTTDCKGLADVLAAIGDKWTIMIVGSLSKGPLRYNEIQRRVGGVSQRMLTLTLKRLETDGIVTRTLFPSVPPRVDYELTQLGQTLRGALVPLHLWAAENKEIIVANRVQAAARGKNVSHTEDYGGMTAAPRRDQSAPTRHPKAAF